jgi:outer membrane protein insertion porin family/translocation and assembly module TamA
MTRALRRASMLLVGCALVSLATGELAAQTDRPEVAEITFEGNEAFPSDSLELAILNRATDCSGLLLVSDLFCWLGADTFRDRQYLVPRQLPNDLIRLERFYYSRGFRGAEADTVVDRSDDAVRLRFVIDEGEPHIVDAIEYEGLDAFPEWRQERLIRDLPIGVGDRLDLIRRDAARNLILARLENLGYAHAEVLIDQFIPADTRAASIRFVLDTGPLVRFGPIDVTNNRILDETSIRRMMPFSEGDLYSRREREEGQRNLYSLEVVRLANVKELGEEFDTIMPIEIEVQEGDLHRVRTAVGWSTSDCVNAEAQWSSRNWLGGARRLQVRARIANILAPQFNQNLCPQTGADEFAELNGQISVQLVQPWIFSPRNSLNINAFVERQSLPDVFIQEAAGFSVGISRLLGNRLTGTLSWEPQLTRLNGAEIFFCASFLVCTEGDIRVFREANWLSPISLLFQLDRTDQILNPSNGWQGTIDLQTASRLTASDFAYQRATATVSGYLEFASGAVAALRLAGGVVTEGEFLRIDQRQGGAGIVHPEKRLYSGGANSVRGFAENRLGPRILVSDAVDLIEFPDGSAVCSPEQVFDRSCDASALAPGLFATRPTGGSRLLEANLELRLPFGGDSFQFVSFVDAGQVWEAGVDIDPSDIEVTPGVGFRYFSPVGPIRIDLGLRPDQQDALPVVSSGIRPFDPDADDPGRRLRVPGPGGLQTIDWVRTGDLIFLDPPVAFGRSSGFFQRIQLHISIGQAF